jgi:hypothetical protein
MMMGMTAMMVTVTVRVENHLTQEAVPLIMAFVEKTRKPYKKIIPAKILVIAPIVTAIVLSIIPAIVKTVFLPCKGKDTGSVLIKTRRVEGTVLKGHGLRVAASGNRKEKNESQKSPYALHDAIHSKNVSIVNISLTSDESNNQDTGFGRIRENNFFRPTKRGPEKGPFVIFA